jgi:hypothetical protein
MVFVIQILTASEIPEANTITSDHTAMVFRVLPTRMIFTVSSLSNTCFTWCPLGWHELETVGIPFHFTIIVKGFDVKGVFIIGVIFHRDDNLFFYHHFERVFGSVEVGSCATEPAIDPSFDWALERFPLIFGRGLQAIVLQVAEQLLT